MCLDGQNACPPEDVGGVPGYAEGIGQAGHRQTCAGKIGCVGVEQDQASIGRTVASECDDDYVINVSPSLSRSPI
nr:plasmid pRiA4b ORF-3 family protein [Burkholderia cepacia]